MAPPPPTKVPWRKLLVTAGVLAVVGGPCGVVVADGIEQGDLDREAGYREHCVPVAPETIASITARFADLGDRTERAWGSAVADDGALWVSVELETPTQAVGTVGDIATWEQQPHGSWLSAERNARAHSTWPPVEAGVDISTSGGVESRWCAMDLTRDWRNRGLRVDPPAPAGPAG